MWFAEPLYTARDSAPNFIDMIAKEQSDQFSRSFSLCYAADGGYFTIGGQDERYLDKNSQPIVVHYTNTGQYSINIHGLSVKSISFFIPAEKKKQHLR